jgi:hypothetical protein
VEHESLGVCTSLGGDARAGSDRRRLRTSTGPAGLIMLEPSRKHGHFDQRWSVPFFRSTSTTPSVVTANGSSGSVNGVQSSEQDGRVDPLEQEYVADGLSWETFCEIVYPGTRRHDFHAIGAWNRYRDRERSS